MLHRTFVSATIALAMLAGVAGCSKDAKTHSPEGAKAVAPTSTPDPIIPRATLMGNPDRAVVRMSPDGKWLSWSAPVEGVMNIWVAPASDPKNARALTKQKERPIFQYSWAYNSQTIVYRKDSGGDENWKLWAVDVSGNAPPRDLTPFEDIKGPDGKPIMLPSGKPLRPTAQIEGSSEKFPDEFVIGLNNRNPEYHDLYRLNLKTGQLTKLYQNDEWASFVVDDDFNIRMASKSTPDGGMEFHTPDGSLSPEGKGTWKLAEKVSADDSLTTNPLGFDKSGQVAFWIDSRGRNTAALVAKDLRSGQSTLIAQDARADAGGAMIHPVNKNVQAVSFEYDRTRWQVTDPSIQGDMDYLRSVADGEMNVTSRTLDDATWLVAYRMDNGPIRYYRYDRAAKKAAFLFTNQASLESLPLAKMNPVVIKSRDGLDLVSYLTLPRWLDTDHNARPDAGAIPMVLLVHGGPWARDSWGFSDDVQHLANRGYAVLQVNFRGSTGLGKSFTNAGNLQWAKTMHDDLIDAVNWAVDQKIAQKDKVAIMGGSYGGYATLVGLTFTPEVFAAGVDIVGPSNLVTLLNSIPPYWAPLVNMFAGRVGDPRTEEGRKLLESRSPLNFVDKIQRPLLIAQGANDPRVKQAEADQIVKKMQEKNIPVTYVLFPDEGHGFARPENNRAFTAVAEAFLATHLGGRSEPIGTDFNGSSITVPAGKDLVAGVSDALPKK